MHTCTPLYEIIPDYDFRVNRDSVVDLALRTIYTDQSCPDCHAAFLRLSLADRIECTRAVNGAFPDFDVEEWITDARADQLENEKSAEAAEDDRAKVIYMAEGINEQAVTDASAGPGKFQRMRPEDVKLAAALLVIADNGDGDEYYPDGSTQILGFTVGEDSQGLVWFDDGSERYWTCDHCADTFNSPIGEPPRCCPACGSGITEHESSQQQAETSERRKDTIEKCQRVKYTKAKRFTVLGGPRGYLTCLPVGDERIRDHYKVWTPLFNVNRPLTPQLARQAKAAALCHFEQV